MYRRFLLITVIALMLVAPVPDAAQPAKTLMSSLPQVAEDS